MTRAELLAAFLEAARSRVDAALDAFLPRPPACPAVVGEAMRYSVFAGGKRLRPVLTLASAGISTGEPAVSRAEGSTLTPAMMAALPAACAIEMIHTYSLIHDDLPAMDDDTLRRGRPTLHVVYGDGIAVLAGDGLHAEAFGLLAREPAGDDPMLAARKLRVLRIVAEAAGPGGMVGGQAIDLQAAGRARGERITLDADGLRAMHARKTGALIRASAGAGAVMGGHDDAIVGATDRFAANLGLAFQIVDDILDVEGKAQELGKSTGKDAAGGKPTYPALFGLERSRTLAAEAAAAAHAALDEAGVRAELLHAIVDWAVTRRN